MIFRPNSRFAFRSICLLLGVLCTSSVANAQTPITVPDSDFEEIFEPGWTTFGSAFQGEANEVVSELIDTPDIGFQSLKLFGNFTGEDNFSGAFQDIAIDGTILKVGDLIQLDGFGATPVSDTIVGSLNDAFMEITWVSNGTVPELPAGDEFGFGDTRTENVAVLGEDQWFQMFTTGTFVPEAASHVRVKAVLKQVDDAAGAVWFDNISLNIIPEVTGFVCDADGDEDCDITDLDLLYAAFGTSGPLDLDGSGNIDAGDIDDWLTAASDVNNPAKADPADVYVLGDLNLNGDVNSEDLGLLLNNFNNAAGLGYGAGNLNDDVNVNSTDLGALLNNFGFTSASLSAAAVPEPSSAILLSLVGFGLMVLRRRK